MDYTLEVIVVPVSDVDRAKAFYTEKMGFSMDHDHDRDHGPVRVVQLTPPGSGCSIVIGTGLADMEPGSLKGVQLVVSDLDAAKADLQGRGVETGDIQQVGPPGTPGARFLFFADPDGNGWAVQEILPEHRS
jgi:catechol 2,3-dioxygenase-like lactoylglutathione lyase family enzyme